MVNGETTAGLTAIAPGFQREVKGPPPDAVPVNVVELPLQIAVCVALTVKDGIGLTIKATVVVFVQPNKLVPITV